MIAAVAARIARLLGKQGPELLRDLVSLATGQVASMALGFAAFAYLARVLDPVSYGAVEYAIAIAALAAIVIECGAGTIGVRELAKRPQAARELAADVPAARFLLALLVVPLAGFSSELGDLQPAAKTLVWLYAISLLGVPLKQDWLLQGFERMTQAALAQPFRTAVFAAGVFLFVRQAEDLTKVGMIEIAAVAAVSLYFVVAQYRCTVPFHWRWSLAQPLYLMREGAAVGLSNALWVFMLYAPMIMLTSLVGGAGPAWLGAAQRLVISAITLSFVYHFNLYPVITRTVAGDLAKWERLMAASCRLMAWAGIGIALGVVLLRDEIMALVFGSVFAAGGPALAVLIWVFPLRTLTGHARWSLVAAGNQRHLLMAEVVGAITLLAVGFIAIPAMDAAGGAVAFVSGILVSGIVTQIAVNRLVGHLSLLRSAALPAALALAGLGVALLVEGPVLLQAAAGMAVYGLGALTQVRQALADVQTVAYAKAA